MQAQTVLRSAYVAERLWSGVAEELTKAKLPERAAWALFDAASGLRVRTAAYARDAQIEMPTAARDMRMLVAAGFIQAHGETKARSYLATPRLRQLRELAADGQPHLADPYGP